MSEKVTNILEEIKSLTVMEVKELVDGICEAFGVSATAAAAAPAASDAAPAEAAKSEYEVILKEVGPRKMDVIKVVKDITGEGLKEAKAIVDGAPVTLKKGVSQEEADDIAKKLKEVEAVVELK